MFDVLIFEQSAGKLTGKYRLKSLNDILQGDPADVKGKVLFLAEKLYDSMSRPEQAADVHLVRRALKGLDWVMYSFPSVSSKLTFSTFLLRQFAGEFELANLMPNRMKCFFRFMLDRKRLVEACTKGNSTLAVLVRGKSTGDFGLVARNLGIRFKVNEKTEKRASQILRPYLVSGSLPYGLIKDRIKIIEDPELEKALDGSMVISRRLFMEVAKQVPSLMDHPRMGCKTLNFRAFVPNHGLVKAMALVSDNLPEGVDMVFHRTNVKAKEVAVESDLVYIGWDPQPGKTRAYAGKQTMINAAWFWGIGKGNPRKTRPYAWALEELAKLRKCIEEGRTPEEDPDELEELLASGRIESGFTTRSRFNALEWAAAGGKTAELPSLFKSTIDSAFDQIVGPDKNDLDFRVQIPGGVYCQIVSQEMIKEVDPYLYKTNISEGQVVYLASHKVLVVNTKWWVANLINFGGCDGDDKFTAVFRLVDGVIKVFVYRTPNSRNEYAVLEYPEGFDLPPLEGDWKAEPWFMPKVGRGKQDRPPQMSWLENKKLLPEPLPKVEFPAGGDRDANTFLDTMGDSTNPGWFVLIETMWDSGIPYKKCPLPPQESVVDLCVAIRNKEQLSWLTSRAFEVIEEMQSLAGKDCKFDAITTAKVFGVAKASYDRVFEIPKDCVEDMPYVWFLKTLRCDVRKEKERFAKEYPALVNKAWLEALPVVRKCVQDFRDFRGKDAGNSLVVMVQDRINKVFREFSLAHKDELVNRFRAVVDDKTGETRLAEMGFQLVREIHRKKLTESLKAVWKQFGLHGKKIGFRFTRKSFARLVGMIALYQLYGQANPDKPCQLHGNHAEGARDNGKLVLHPGLFRYFLSVRDFITYKKSKA